MLFIGLLCCTVCFTIVFVYFRRGAGGATQLTPTTEGEFDSFFFISLLFLGMKRSFNIYDTKDTFVLLCVYVYCSVSNIFCIISVALPPFNTRGKTWGCARIQRRPPVRAHVVTNRWSKALYLVVCVGVCMLSEIKSATGAKCFLPCVLTCSISLQYSRVQFQRFRPYLVRFPGTFPCFEKLSSSGRPVECVCVCLIG